MSWCSDLASICQADVPLADHTWYGLGGRARWLVTPRNEDELAETLSRCVAAGVRWRILGRGANLLVRDAGVDGAVIKLDTPHWTRIEIERTSITAGAGADFTRVVRESLAAGLVGLEGLAGIPGSVGGIVRMNAGGKWGEIGAHVVSVRVMTPRGDIVVRSHTELDFAYRHSTLDGGIVLSATFALDRGDAAAALAQFREVWQQKHAEQPSVSMRSAGCIFKNPPGHAAGALIDQAGLKGLRHGGAEISTRHANFIVTRDGATAADVLTLIETARARVRQDTGIELELEIEVW